MFEGISREDLTLLGMAGSMALAIGIWVTKIYNETLIICVLFPLFICLFLAYVVKRD